MEENTTSTKEDKSTAKDGRKVKKNLTCAMWMICSKLKIPPPLLSRTMVTDEQAFQAHTKLFILSNKSHHAIERTK